MCFMSLAEGGDEPVSMIDVRKHHTLIIRYLTREYLSYVMVIGPMSLPVPSLTNFATILYQVTTDTVEQPSILVFKSALRNELV